MSIKVVRGIIHNSSQLKNAGRGSSNLSSTINSKVVVTKAPALANTEASVNALRSTKGSLTRNSIRDEQDAKNTAKDVAEEIRGLSSPEDVHDGLGSVNTKGHLYD